MNELVQNILVFIALGASLAFLIRKFIWKPQMKKSGKDCGSNDCGCH